MKSIATFDKFLDLLSHAWNILFSDVRHLFGYGFRQAKAERQRLHDESRAFEAKQREEQRAEQVLRIAAVCI
jgi:hypothetical protein